MTEPVEKIDTVKNLDGWSNVLTGLGTFRDPTSAMCPSSLILDDTTLRMTFTADCMARKIVSMLPFHAFKEGYVITSDKAPDDALTLTRRLQTLQADAKIKDAWKWANLYGFSCIVFAASGDGTEMIKPLTTVIPRLAALLVFESPEVTPDASKLVVDPTDAHYGLPEFYDITPASGIKYRVHYSRIIEFYGVIPPRFDFERRNFKGLSILQGIYATLQGWATAHGSLPVILKDFTQVVYQVKDLASQLQCEGGERALLARFRVMQQVSGILNAIVLDTDENFTKHGSPVSGLKDLVELCKMRLVAETGIPHTLLLGESASGLGATGEDLRLNWFDTVASQQEEIVRPALRRIIDVIRMEQRTTDEYEIVFRNLWKSTPKEEQEARLNQAKADQIYADMGLSPEIILRSRFGGDEYSPETRLEEDDLDDMEEAAEENEVSSTPSEQAAATARKSAMRPDGLLGEISTLIALRKPLKKADIAALVVAFQRLDSKDTLYSALGGDSAKTWANARWKEIGNA